jgi:hypothetical protein
MSTSSVLMRTFLAAALVVAVTAPAAAQATRTGPETAVGGGLTISTGGNVTEVGIKFDFTRAIREMTNGNLAIVAEFGFQNGDGFNTILPAGGVRYNLDLPDAPVKVFVQGLVGVHMFRSDFGNESALTIAPGGGVRFPVNNMIDVYGQFDIFLAFFEGDTETNPRISGGILINLGANR